LFFPSPVANTLDLSLLPLANTLDLSLLPLANTLDLSPLPLAGEGRVRARGFDVSML
jgi:hypothetical protein